MNINEKLQEVEKIFKYSEHEKLILDTIKQLQEENEKLRSMRETVAIAHQENLERKQQRIEELEKENEALDRKHNQTKFWINQCLDAQKQIREITAAHEAFSEEIKYLNLELYYEKGLKSVYERHFQFLHLAEQVRLAKLSAGVDGE
ncbi:hypothetical protein HMPREF3291_05125 [Bacillus sp. HMSC76G11]|nr:hypothetical protein HMPREF3291_05125 [Bacillus sp. HMSC76G11]